MTLYHLVDDCLRIHDMLVECGGEVTPEIEAMLDEAMCGMRSDKVEGVLKVAANLKQQARSCEEESRRLAEMSRSRKRSAERLTEYLKHQMMRLHRKSIDTDLFGVRLVKNSQPRIRWEGLGDIPEEFARTKMTVELNKEEAQRSLKANGFLPEGFVVEQDYHIQVM